ncbi:MAG TPA: sulfur globule protein CV1 [Planctomycetaceae bacterium]|nr:sulfur globule protein CV1 [Planctomycetaceae bacterium]HQZ66401.1 sulfur globule protein CV1 [Planctomycetaceae bacterium]HRA89300.1 sulfur globule protein CV1 [Planctomycetaceae bacterium]
MKKFLVCMAALGCLVVVGASNTKADHYHGGGSRAGFSINFGNGYNNFGGGYSNLGGYSQPHYGGGYGGYGNGYGGGYGGGYPVYRSTQIYSAPVYGGGYGGYGGGYSGGYGGGYGHHCH